MTENLQLAYREIERFQVGDAAALKFLEQEGFVVYRHALREQEAAQAVSLLWDYLEGLQTGIDRQDVSTWGDDRWPTAVHGGILPGFGIGHTAAQWFIRDIDAVKQCFADIWQTDDLLTSFDGVTLWRPWAYNPAWKTNLGSSWLHIDQHPIGRPGRHCVQGVVNLLPTSPSSGGNVVVPGSHRRFDRIPDDYAERLARIHPSIDHFRFPNDDPQLADTQPIMAHLDAGDMLLWDSRTIHCSSHGLETSTETDRLLRAASLICMMPRSKSNEKVISQRKAAVANLTSTTNWSDRFINADEFPQILETPDPERYQLPPVPKLNHNQLRLVGWTEEEITAGSAH